MDALTNTFRRRIQDYDIGHRILYGAGTDKDTWLNWHGIRQLKKIIPKLDFPENHRVLIFAPHPDDEILGCAGLMQQLNHLAREIVLVAITNGTASHPASSIYTSEQLNQIRPQESRDALAILNLNHIQRIELALPDGEIEKYAFALADKIQALIQTNDILISMHEFDGHPDHELSAYVVKEISKVNKLKYFQVFVWTWHWAKPNQIEIDWTKAKCLDLSDQEIKLKEQAIRCFKSQIHIDPSTGNAPILSEDAIQRILMPFEVYIDEN